MNKILFIISLVGLISCKKEVVQTTHKVITPATKIDAAPVTPVVLIDGTKIISDWLELDNFQSELQSVVSKQIESEKELEQLINYLNKLKETTPEKYRVPSVRARIKVMETELLMLNQYVKDQDYKSAAARKMRLQKAYNLFVKQLESLLIKERDYEKYK